MLKVGEKRSGRPERRPPIHPTNGFGNTFLYKAVKKNRHFQCTLSGRGEGGKKKRTFCTLVNNGDNWTSRLTDRLPSEMISVLLSNFDDTGA